MSSKRLLISASFAAASAALTSQSALASSHREAPMVAEDPTVDATDLYAFRNGNNLVIVANYIPMEHPSGGPNFHKFSDNAVYRINIDNNGDAQADIVYEFSFRTTRASDTTFLYNTGPIPAGGLNVRQLMTVTRTVGAATTTEAMDMEVAPAYVGRNSFTSPSLTPGNAPNDPAADAAYDSYVAANNIRPLASGGQVFAGPRDDPFFVDLGATFDLLRVRPLDPTPGSANFGHRGGGVDDLAAFNVHSLVIEVPIASVATGGAIPTDPNAAASILGVWTTAHRPRVHVLRGNGVSEYHGQLVQVSRLGFPLVNEALIPLGMKDAFNASVPANDVSAFGPLVLNNEVTNLLNALYLTPLGTPADPSSSGVGGTLLAVLTGFNAGITPSDMLHINLAVPGNPFPAPGSAATVGVFGGDSAGFPNGRRLADDIVDVVLRVAAGAADTRAGMAPNNLLGDGVYQNDAAFAATFPYLARPHEGYAQNVWTLNPVVATGR